MIYQDVLTEKTPEGEATLVEKLKDDGCWDRSEFWNVQFVGDEPGTIYPRWCVQHDGG